MSEPQLFRYSRRDLATDYVRASFGGAICLVPPVFLDVATVMAWVLIAVGAVFVIFGLRTLLRHMTVYELGSNGMRASGPIAATVCWNGLSAMNLAYFSIRRRKHDRTGFSGTGGWMELTVREGNRAIKVDSSLEGFDDIVHLAVNAARERRLQLNSVTLANLAAMGFIYDANGGEGSAS